VSSGPDAVGDKAQVGWDFVVSARVGHQRGDYRLLAASNLVQPRDEIVERARVLRRERAHARRVDRRRRSPHRDIHVRHEVGGVPEYRDLLPPDRFALGDLVVPSRLFRRFAR